jgi:predicted dinucleotide-binding enzyme
MTQRIGILGAGKLGTVVARLAVAAGYEVRIAGSGDPKFIALNVDVGARGAIATTAVDAVANADLVILAIPFHGVDAVPADALAGHIVIDATNHWADVDGPLPPHRTPGGTSTAVARKFPRARIVKALSHVAYQELEAHARDTRRIALGVASDDVAAANAVAAFVERLGFDAVMIGPLAAGIGLQPGSHAFGAALGRDALLRSVRDLNSAPSEKGM